MKKAMALVFCLAPIAFALPSGGNLTAEKVVERVSRTYSSLRSFRLVEHREGRAPTDSTNGEPLLGIQPERLSGSRMPLARYIFPPLYGTDLAESTPGRIRLETGGVLVVSNGETMWAYLPVLNQYLQAAAVPLLQEMWARPAYYGSDDIFRYRSLSHEAGRAKLRGEETLSLGGQEVRCYVVDVPDPSGSRRLWVDERRFIVLQDAWVSGPGSGPDTFNPDSSYFADSGVWTSRLTKADLGPIPDETFEFVPPAGARRVASFRAPLSRSQGGENARAYRLLESGEEDLVNRLVGGDVLVRMKAKKPPDFTAEGLDGRALRLKDLHGKAIVLDFYTTWCKPCQRDLPAIQKLYTDLRGKDVAFLGIDEGEDRERVKNFLTKNGYTFPTLLDSDHALPGFYRTGWVPTVVVINRKGKIAAQYIGAGGEEQLRPALKSAGLNTTP
ncbi:MAG: redoxin domain-containing protein [Terriglobia bacterium]|jgi:peroxiredoxin/outer membrane lipoprotein-sorting protein